MRRDLPWRRTRDPWAVLVSETMLQQTQVARVVPRFLGFIERFPTVRSCADVPAGEVLRWWSGLGYNSRALRLHAAARVVADELGGRFPSTLEGLRRLPGIGPYTARAVLAFAFEADAAVVDTNIARTLARWHGRPLRPAEVQALADAHAAGRPGLGVEPVAPRSGRHGVHGRAPALRIVPAGARLLLVAGRAGRPPIPPWARPTRAAARARSRAPTARVVAGSCVPSPTAGLRAASSGPAWPA